MKKAFTLLEILIVVIIISLMIWALGYFMPNKENKQIKFGKISSINIYTEIENSLQNFRKNKTLNSWWVIYNVDKIQIEVNSGSAYILVKFTNTITIKEQYLTKINEEEQKYNIKINSWRHMKASNTNLRDIQFEWTWAIINSCIEENTNCIPISKIIFNKAAQTIQQKFCLDFSWSTCNEWE